MSDRLKDMVATGWKIELYRDINVDRLRTYVAVASKDEIEYKASLIEAPEYPVDFDMLYYVLHRKIINRGLEYVT